MPSKKHSLAVRGDRIVAKSTLARQQRDMAKVAHAAIKQYLILVRRGVAHTRITAAAAPKPAASDPDPYGLNQDDDVDLNGLDQSAAWPGILEQTLLPSIGDLLLGIGPQGDLSPAVAMSINAWRAQWLSNRTQALAGVPDQITKQIRDAVTADASENGPNPRSAAKIVTDLLNPDAPTWASRANTIARTEVVGANNQGGLASWTAVHESLQPVGGQVYKTWLATSDNLTRPDHAEIDGTEIGIGETFTVGGQEMNGPGDNGGDADEVINCRCTLTYRVDDGTDAGDDLNQAEAEDADAAADDNSDESGDDAMTAAAPEAPADTKPYEPAPYHVDPDETVKCPNCSKMDDTDAVYCDQCGFELKGATGVVVAPPAADAAAVTAGASHIGTATTITLSRSQLLAAVAPDTLPPLTPGPTPAAALTSPVGATQWSGVLMDLDKPSSDGRMFMSAGLTIRQLPLPLSYQCEGEHGGDPSGTTVVVGRILTAQISGNQITATGDFFDPMTSDAPTAAIEQVAGGIGCVSIDAAVQIITYLAPGPAGTLIPIDPMQYMGDPMSVVQVAEQSEIAGATIVSFPAFADARITLVTDPSAPNLDPVAITADAATPAGPVLTTDSITFQDGTVLNVGDQVNVIDATDPTAAVTTGVIEAIDPDNNSVTVTTEDATGAKTPQTVDAGSLQVVSSLDNGDTDSAASGVPSGLTAALAFPGLAEEHVYPAEWFGLPDLSEIERRPHINITADGRVQGLLAQSGTCHIGFIDQCVSPPNSPSNYAHFHVGEVKTDQGFLACGKLTVGGGHADIRAGWRGAVEHYDNAGAAAAVVRAYDTEIGVVLAGALLPQTTPEQVAALRRNDCSGDWRPIGGHRELVAALSVNTGGFPLTPRAALAADGRPGALVAAGVVHGDDELTQVAMTLPSGAKLSRDDVAVLASAFADVTDQRRQQQRVAADARALKSKLIKDRILRAV